MKFNIRPYQAQIIESAIEGFKKKSAVLIQAPTGAGKTVIFCFLIEKFLKEFPGMRILVLVHREILVTQNRDKLLRSWPEAPIGIACAGTSKTIDIHSPVVFGSVQTLAKRVNSLPPFHLVIVDEAHRLPPQTIDSQYRQVLWGLKNHYSGLRLLGLTATPFRLAHGDIYGLRCKRTKPTDNPNWFDALDHQLSILDLQNQQPDDDNPDAPYLCKMKVFVEDRAIEADLAKIKTTGGEFNQAALGKLMREGLHISSAVQAYKDRVGDRTRCAVFGVDIAHAQALVDAFEAAGVSACQIHSEMSKEDRARSLSDFAAGRVRVIVNVGVLTEGWDCPECDMLIMARPTLSAALFVQMVGRGLRIAPGKIDVLILDLSGNFNRHGPPWAPILPEYRAAGERKKEVIKRPEAKCPECEKINPAGQWTCQNCGAVLRVRKDEEAVLGNLKELNLDRFERAQEVPGIKGEVVNSKIWKYTTSRGASTLRVDVAVKMAQADDLYRTCLPVCASHFFRLDGPGVFYFRRWWKCLAGDPVPETLEQAETEKGRVKIPAELNLKQEGKYWKVVGW